MKLNVKLIDFGFWCKFASVFKHANDKGYETVEYNGPDKNKIFFLIVLIQLYLFIKFDTRRIDQT